MKAFVNRRQSKSRSMCAPAVIEGLENRQLLSASPIILKAVTPKKITAGGSGTEVVTIHNLTAVSVSEPLVITLAPSLDGATAAGAYASSGVNETISLKKHGSLTIKVPFTTSDSLAGGVYHTLDTVTLAGATTTTTAPGTYTYIAPTTTPSLVGEFSGLIIAYKSTSTSTGVFGTGTNTQVSEKDLTFRWTTTSQTDDSLTGLFAVGEQQETGTMTGTELTNGMINYTFSSALINYTVSGTVTNTAKGEIISGLFKGTLVNNLFSTLNGHFKITAGSTH